MRSRDLQISVKHAVDKALSLLLFVALLPLMLIIAILIVVGDGKSPFFRQKRVGRYGGTFKILKFRTMRVDADSFLDQRGRVTDQSRVTWVGRYLRYSSLDELPNLVNIIKGDMSLVGPRPAVPEHLRRYTELQKRRLEMRPGVTGLSQISGRNTLAWTQRIKLDIEYIDEYSLWLDLKILAQTPGVILRRQGVVLDRNPDDVDDLRPLLDSKAEGGNDLSD